MVDLGERQQLTLNRDMDRPMGNGSVPSAQQNGLASVKPRRICPADGQRRQLLDYLRRNNESSYKALIEKLGIRR